MDALFILTRDYNFPKIIIDVGANSNATISTPFIAEGWSALLIEPQKSCIELLLNRFDANSSVDILRCGCSDEETTLRLYYAKEGEGSELATFSQSDDPWMSMVRNKNHYEDIAVRRLSDIIDSKPNFENIGILKVDTESFDYKVILGVDFNRHHPKIIITEEYLWNVDDVTAKHKLLEYSGYVCLGWSGYNTIWICRQFFKISWTDIGLWPWLKRINRSHPIIALLPELHNIDELIDCSRYWDNCLSELDILISARDIKSTPSAHFTIPIAISNFGLRLIPSLPNLNSNELIQISYHIKEGNDYVLWDGIKTNLGSDIKPSDSVILDMNFVAPSNPGKYLIEIDLVVEGVAWYSSKVNSSPCCISLTINNH